MAIEQYTTSCLEREANVVNVIKKFHGVCFKLGAIAATGVVGHELIKGFNLKENVIAATAALISAVSLNAKKEAELYITSGQQGSNTVQ